MMLLTLLVACEGPDSSSSTLPSIVPTTPTEPTVADTGLPSAPPWRSPAEAVDLDPDPDVLHVELTAARHPWDAGKGIVDGYAYNEQVPGPTLRASLGDTLVVDLVNETDLDTSLHWHGLSVPYAMDGAGWQVDPVPPGGRFQYTFPLTQAGTFWYHPHFNTARSVDLGLYGVVVVEDPADPPVEDDVVVVLDTVAEHGADEEPHGAKPSGGDWLVNGMREPQWAPPSGSIVRMRLVNVSNHSYLALSDQQVIGGDQGLLPVPTTSVVLPPGDRAELLWALEPGGTSLSGSSWSPIGPGLGEGVTLFTVQPSGSARPPSATWPSNPLAPTPDPGRTDLRYTFTGSPLEGWEINGQTFPDIAPDVVGVGEEIILEIRNPSPSRHPYHLHGLTFEVLAINGEPPAQRRIEDTLDVGIRDVVRLRIVADNPGDWMSHCHILPHAERGMMTVLTVRAGR